MRNWIMLTLLMATMSLGLAVYQWWDFHNIIAEEDVGPNVDVNLYESNHQVNVNLTVNQLQDNKLIIELPNVASKVSCTNSQDESCTIQNQTITLKETHEVSLTYSLPFNEEEGLLLNWLPKFQLNDQQVTLPIKLTMTSPINEGWNWYTFKKPNYSDVLERINYHQWTFNNVESIPMVKSNAQYEAVYGQKHQTLILSHIPYKFEPFIELLDLFDVKNQIFIINPDQDPTYNTGVSVINHTEKRKIASGLLGTTIKRQLTEQTNHSELLINILNAFFFSMEIQSDKAAFLSNQLNQHLTRKQKEEWLNVLINHKEELNNLDQYLDESLKELDIYTDFFVSNMTNEPNVPFYEYDQREITLNNEEVDWKGILYNDTSYLPLEDIVEDTELTFSELREGELMISKGNERIRIYPKRDLYILNETHYQFIEEFLVKLNDRMYINSEVASKIFSLSIQRSK
ncbi:hypothetical protein E3U55_05745 [Filobacillus milosensis]|uniref:Copper amine oxidase-like N-terminal domain-containing protein n=1 Tax=Filobacillus milosensis TaxID=94137 RepID=A0A4Y8IR60_9BACI|nr:hypothetical protein [Filobacillus milosensis]TFB23321.1 hypothetical protein E3U55_05745 [Filobacillus milosensis]